jgi:hypothetical protein
VDTDACPSWRLTVAIGIPLLSMSDAAVWRRSRIRSVATPALATARTQMRL